MLGKLFNRKTGDESRVQTIPSTLDEENTEAPKAQSGTPLKPQDYTVQETTAVQESFEKSRQEKSAEKQAEILAAREFFRKRNNLNALIADEIRTSLRAKRVKFLYQGIFNTAKAESPNEPIFYEVFTHLLDKSGRATEPRTYIPVANKSGLANWLDEVVFEMLLTARKNEDAKFSINLTGHTLRRSMDFFEQLMTSVSETGFPPRKLIFELRLAEIDKDGNTLKFIKEARDMQFRFALDYVGGGPRIIEMVKKLGFDFLKIDAIQFAEAAKNDKLYKELSSITKAAQKNKMKLIMERVETKAMFELSKKLGFDYMQGYYLSMPSEELEKGMR